MNWPSRVSLKQHLFSHENIFEITWLKWITWVLSSQTKRSYDSQSYGGWIVWGFFFLGGGGGGGGGFAVWHVESLEKSLWSASFWQWDKPSLQSNFSQLIWHVSLFQECCRSNIQINLKSSWFIKMKCIPSYCTKRKNSMLCRITWNVFFVHWVARGKYRLIPHFASCNSKPSPPASMGPLAGWSIPRHFASHVTTRSTLIG